MPYTNSTRTVDNGVGVDVALAGAGNLFVASGLLSAQKSITLSDGFLNNGAPEENLIIPVLFPNGHNDLGPSLHATVAVTGVTNPIPIVSNQQGTLNPLPNHQMTEGGSTVYKSIQPNTILSMYYTADYDGSQNPAFVIAGNPTVLSFPSYSVFADGSSTLDASRPVNSVYVQFPGQLSPNDPGLWGNISTWTEIDYKGRFFRAKGGEGGNNANAFSTTVDGNVQAEGLPNITGSLTANYTDMSYWARTLVDLGQNYTGAGAFVANQGNNSDGIWTGGDGGHTFDRPIRSVSFNASSSNAIYGANNGAQNHVVTRNQTIIVWKRTA